MPKTSLKISFANVIFSGPDIKSATVTEEFSPLSITVPINTFQFSLYSNDVTFSIINPTGKYESLLKKQPMTVHEIVDGVERYIGLYYLEDWVSSSKDIKTFTCSDVLSILDKNVFYGGFWSSPVTVGSLVAGLFNTVGLGYSIDPVVAAMTVTGWLPILTYRETLQQILFAVGAYVLVSRETVPVIGQMAQVSLSSYGQRIGFPRTGQSRNWQRRWRKGQEYVFGSGNVVTQGIRSGIPHTGQSRVWQKRWRVSQWGGAKPVIDVPTSEQGSRELSLRPQVTGVEVTAHDIISDTGILELFNGTLAAGIHEIRFSQPIHDLVLTGSATATITASGANYATINVTVGGTVLLSGQVYIDTQTLFGKYLLEVEYKEPNVITITNGTLVNSTNANDICNRAFYYFQQRYVQYVKFYSPSSEHIRVGGTVLIKTLYENNLYGVVEKMTTDLANGNISNAEIVGVIIL